MIDTRSVHRDNLNGVPERRGLGVEPGLDTESEDALDQVGLHGGFPKGRLFAAEQDAVWEEDGGAAGPGVRLLAMCWKKA